MRRRSQAKKLELVLTKASASNAVPRDYGLTERLEPGESEDVYVRAILQSLKEIGDDLTCPICMSLISDAKMTACRHAFCKNCLLRHLDSGKNSCPVCKAPARKRETRDCRKLEKILSHYKGLHPRHPKYVQKDKQTFQSEGENVSDPKSSEEDDDEEEEEDQEEKENDEVETDGKSKAVVQTNALMTQCGSLSQLAEGFELDVDQLYPRKSTGQYFEEHQRNLLDSSDEEEDDFKEGKETNESGHKKRNDEEVNSDDLDEDEDEKKLFQHHSPKLFPLHPPSTGKKRRHTLLQTAIRNSANKRSPASSINTPATVVLVASQSSSAVGTPASRTSSKEDELYDATDAKATGNRLSQEEKQKAIDEDRLDPAPCNLEESLFKEKFGESCSSTSSSSSPKSFFQSAKSERKKKIRRQEQEQKCSEAQKIAPLRKKVKFNERRKSTPASLGVTDSQVDTLLTLGHRESTDQRQERENKENQAEKPVLNVGTLVTVARRMQPGMNQPGGVGKILRWYENGTYDIKYTLDGRREKGVDQVFVTPGIDIDSSSLMGSGRTPLKPRGQASYPNTLSLDAKGRPKRTIAPRDLFNPETYVSDAELARMLEQSQRSSFEEKVHTEDQNRSTKKTTRPKRSRSLSVAGRSSSSSSKKAKMPNSPVKSEYQEPVVVMSSLPSESKRMKLMNMIHTLKGSLGKQDCQGATHLVVQTSRDNKNVAKARTLKYVQAMSLGLWIVDPSWVRDSSHAGFWIDEADYEIAGDMRTIDMGDGGPRKARLDRGKPGEKGNLLRNSSILFCGTFEGDAVPPLSSMHEFVTNCGGKMRKKMPNFKKDIQRLGEKNCFVICQDADDAAHDENFKLVSRGSLKVPVVDAQWLLNSISLHTLQNPVRYKIEFKS